MEGFTPLATLANVTFPNVAAPSPQFSAEAATRAAEEFEAVFIAQMLESMFEGLDPDSLFGGGQSEDVYRSLLSQEYGKSIAQAGGIGMADAVRREILKLQEVQ